MDIKVQDLDNDGKRDVVVVNFGGGGTVQVFKNNAVVGTINAASLALNSTIATATGPECVEIADVDGDGKADICIGMKNTPGSIQVVRNTNTVAGTMSFAGIVTAAAGLPRINIEAVSYTHLTLPTNREV